MSAMRRYLNLETVIPFTLLMILLGSLNACADATAAVRGADVPSRRVRFADLDLTRSAGAAILYSRIHSAAREVCEPAIVRFPQKWMVGTRRCVDEAIARAVADVNAPALTSYYLAKMKPTTIKVAQQ
jgi:UrcA family protein